VKRRECIGSLALSLLAACTSQLRQFDLNDRPLTCEQANQYAYRTLQVMGFAITEFEPAASGQPGTLRGWREHYDGTQRVTVAIACSGATAGVTASEDGRFVGLLEFKRGFYMTFTSLVSQAQANAAASAAEAQRPLEQRRTQGLQVLLQPVHGLGAKLDLGLDLAAGGVLPVSVTIMNVSARRYTLAPEDIVLVRRDGTRVHALAAAAAAAQVARALRQAAGDAAPDVDAAAIKTRLESRLFSSRSVAANETVSGYLYFPLAAYVKGRVVLEDVESEESEGVMVEF